MTSHIINLDRSWAVIDSCGAYIRSLWLSHNEILMESEDGNQTHGGCASLIPFANRVRDASYSWIGRRYYLPRNDRNNSIHGFTKDMNWDISTGDTKMILNSEIDREDYPSRLKCQSTIELKEDSILIRFTISNVGDIDAPLSIGLHPYFLHGGWWKVREPSKVKELNYADKYFPDGTMTEVVSEYLSSGNGREFDNCFLVGPSLGLETAHHIIDVQTENMNYFEIYNGKYSNGKSVAVEPMTSAPDAFNNGIGLVTLRSNSKFTCSSAFSYHIKD
ncbi:MAG: aldose 1-epimerase [Thermoplasmatales archaeon]